MMIKIVPLDGRGDLVLEFLGLDKSKYKITSVNGQARSINQMTHEKQ